MLGRTPAAIQVRQAREREVAAESVGLTDTECLEGRVDLFSLSTFLVAPYFLQDAPAGARFSKDTADFADGPAFKAYFEYRA